MVTIPFGKLGKLGVSVHILVFYEEVHRDLPDREIAEWSPEQAAEQRP